MLYQEGPRDAKIMIVGEAPSAHDIKAGKPSVGYSHDILLKMLSKVGISYRHCFHTNVCHEEPTAGKFEHFYKTKTGQLALMRGMLQLKKDIEEIKPNVVVALGANALKILTGKVGIANWRGSILPSALVPGVKVVATYHPSMAIRAVEFKPIMEFDLKRANIQSGFPEIVRPKRELILDPPVDVLTPLVEELLQAEWLAVDIECVQRPDKSWKLACVGFSDRTDRAVTIPTDSSEKIHACRILLASNVKKVMQNGTFDTTVLRDEGFEVNNFAWDTMIGHHALYAESASGEDEMSKQSGKKRSAAFAKGLAFQTSIYTEEPRYKDDGKIWKETNDLELFWRYNALDAVVTREIRDVQEKDLEAYGNMGTLKHGMSLVEPLMSMTNRGVKIDLDRRAAMKEKLEKEINNLQAFLDAGAGKTINVSSPDVKWLVYDKLQLPKRHSKKTGAVTADKDAIVYLAEKYNNPLLMTIVKIRQRRKLVETYLNAAIDKDDRIRCSFDITGTRSGRLSSRGSIYGSGTNLQNIPAPMREMLIADEGKIFIYRDFSQAEARVVAALADDAYLLELFSDPSRDIHKETASKIFNVPIEEVTDAQRYLGKKVRHAVNYGMDAKRFVEVVNEDSETTGIHITLDLAKRVIEGFWLLHPNHKSVYWAGVERDVKYSRTLSTPFGRKRTFYGRMDDKLLREGYSYIPQSTIGWLCNESLVNMYHKIQLAKPALGFELLLQVHDSVLAQVDKAHVEEASYLMGECMKIEFECNGHKLLIPTDSKVGYNWRDRGKDGSNPNGLMDIEKWRVSNGT